MLLNREMNIERAKATDINALLLTQLLNSRSNSSGQTRESFLGISGADKNLKSILKISLKTSLEKSKDLYLIIIGRYISFISRIFSIFRILHILCISRISINQSINQ